MTARERRAMGKEEEEARAGGRAAVMARERWAAVKEQEEAWAGVRAAVTAREPCEAAAGLRLREWG